MGALADNLISYWKMDESSDGSGAVTRNDSHSTNHLTDNNTIASGTGIISNGADIEKDNTEFLSVADNASLSITGDYSISLWYKPETAPVSDQAHALFSKSIAEYHLDYENGAPGGLRLRCWNNSNPAIQAVDLGTGTFKHIVLVYSDSGDTATFYVNASSIGAPAQTSNPTDSTNDLRLGRRGGSADMYADGIIDEVGLWNRALTSDEVTSLYNGGAGFAYPFTPASSIKTINGLAKASVKTMDGLAIASVKTWDGLA